MARLKELPEAMRSRIADLDCPIYETNPWVEGPPLSQRRVSLISTAGLHTRDDRPFGAADGSLSPVAGDYRIIPGEVSAKDLVMSHVSTNFDRNGFQQDWNVVFPLDRLHELARTNRIGSVANYHYSFMGATAPQEMEPAARVLAGSLKQEGVDAALLVPV